jgi:hypothetical protein
MKHSKGFKKENLLAEVEIRPMSLVMGQEGDRV